MLLVALYRLTKHAASLSWYDTEVNVELMRLAYLASQIEGYEDFTEENGTVFDKGLWVFSDKANMSGNKWVGALQDFWATNSKRQVYHPGFSFPGLGRQLHRNDDAHSFWFGFCL